MEILGGVATGIFALLIFRIGSRLSRRALAVVVSGGCLSLNVLVILAAAALVLFEAPAFSQETAPEQEAAASEQAHRGASGSAGSVAVGAALAAGLAAIGAGIAVAITGSAAIGAITEKPEVLGRSLIFVGLAEGIAIYGLIIAFMILTGGFGG